MLPEKQALPRSFMLELPLLPPQGLQASARDVERCLHPPPVPPASTNIQRHSTEVDRVNDNNGNNHLLQNTPCQTLLYIPRALSHVVLTVTLCGGYQHSYSRNEATENRWSSVLFSK